MRWMVPITRRSCDRLAIFSLAGNDRIDAVLVPSDEETQDEGPERELDEDDTLFVRDFCAPTAGKTSIISRQSAKPPIG